MAGDTVLALGGLIDAQRVVSALEEDLAGVEGETALALVEAGLEVGELEGSSLPFLVAAYREALAFGKKETAQKLQAHIVDEIRRQSQKLSQFLARLHPSARKMGRRFHSTGSIRPKLGGGKGGASLVLSPAGGGFPTGKKRARQIKLAPDGTSPPGKEELVQELRKALLEFKGLKLDRSLLEKARDLIERIRRLGGEGVIDVAEDIRADLELDAVYSLLSDAIKFLPPPPASAESALPHPLLSISDLIKTHPLGKEPLDAIRKQLAWPEQVVEKTQGWGWLWKMLSPERFVDIVFQAAGNFLSGVNYSEIYLAGVRQFLNLLLDLKAQNYPIRIPDRCASLVHEARERLQPHHEAQAVILVDRYFPIGSKEREWFDTEWDKVHGRHHPKDRWEEVGIVVRERLRTAAEWVELIRHLRDYREEVAAQGQIVKDLKKVSALLGLIEELKKRGKLTLQFSDEALVHSLSTMFLPPH